MKTFEFSKETTKKIVKCFNEDKSVLFGIIDDVMALYTIQKCYGLKGKIRIFKTYIDNNIYAFYESDNKILIFTSEEEAIKFIFAL